MKTWPEGIRPKTHFSTSKLPHGNFRQQRAHADYLDPQTFRAILHWMDQNGYKPDIMLECKKKNLALLRLRDELEL